MKPLSKTKALARLKKLKTNYQGFVRKNFEHKAKDCLTCEVQGICCTDAHFVNVHISKLEAIAIKNALGKLDERKRKEIYSRVEGAINEYNLQETGDTFAQKFSCPLFAKDVGCLVHEAGKPIPCIQHACYENREDLPPDELQTKQEKAVERLNAQTFGNTTNWLPLPVWLKKVANLSADDSKK